MEKVEVVAAVNEWMQRVEAAGLPLYSLVEVKFSPRARNWLGACERSYYPRSQRGECILKFATALLELPDSEVINVIVHEILHMIVNSSGHGHVWMEGASRMMERYPQLSITVVANQKASIEFAKALPKRKVYRITCPKCGKVWKYYHKCDVVKHAEAGYCYCPRCKSTLIVEEAKE